MSEDTAYSVLSGKFEDAVGDLYYLIRHGYISNDWWEASNRHYNYLVLKDFYFDGGERTPNCKIRSKYKIPKGIV